MKLWAKSIDVLCEWQKFCVGIAFAKRGHEKYAPGAMPDAYLLGGDPDGNRTRVTAVKGRCLNRLTTGPYNFSGEYLKRNSPLESGSGNWIRTNDTPGMNRML